MTEDFAGFAADLRAELHHEADLDGAEAMVAEVFTRHVVGVIVEAGAMDDVVDCFHANDSVRPAIEVSGYGIQDGDTLNLVTTLYRGADPERLAPQDVRRAFARAEAFFRRCLIAPRRAAYRDSLEEASEAWGMVAQIEDAAARISRIHTVLITDCIAPDGVAADHEQEGVGYRQSVWDIRRLARMRDADGVADPILIDFVERFGEPLPVLSAPSQSDEYDAFLSIIPGEWLAALYDDFGSRLLERNVRSFLQFTGKVNRGIRDTIRKEPGRFLAYNNGISATAADVVMSEDGRGIVSLRDFQVVNGGQTTASIHRMMRERVDIDGVGVQAKITVVDGDLLEELVPKISEYSNNQNKVQLADFSSNDPFHIAVEALSIGTWAPPAPGSNKQTKWFYERARGQYRDAEARAGTPARRREFREIYPTRQRIAKVDLAVFENTWDQLPHEVNKGAQKNFVAFMSRRAGLPGSTKPDAAYFQRLCAKALIFRRAEAIVSGLDLGGYRRPIVSYAISRLSHVTQKRLDLGRIWNEQVVPSEVDDALTGLARVAHGVLTNTSRPVTNVTEWAKSTKCWEAMKAAPWGPPADLEEWLVPLGAGARTAPGQDDEAPNAATAISPEGNPLVDEMSALSGEVFFAVANWAKQTSNLMPWDRKFAYSIGIALSRGKNLSDKQAAHAHRILTEASEAGFDPRDVEIDTVG